MYIEHSKKVNILKTQLPRVVKCKPRDELSRLLSTDMTMPETIIVEVHTSFATPAANPHFSALPQITRAHARARARARVSGRLSTPLPAQGIQTPTEAPSSDDANTIPMSICQYEIRQRTSMPSCI
eukprot:3667359-Pyramimonas_sp.AAC.2